MVKIINHGKVMDNSKLHDNNRFCNITIQRKCCKMPKITFGSLENHFCQLTLTPSVLQQMRSTNNADILVNFCFIRLSFYIFMGDEFCDFDGLPYAKICRNIKRFPIEQKNYSTKITKNLIQNVLIERIYFAHLGTNLPFNRDVYRYTRTENIGIFQYGTHYSYTYRY